MQESHRGDREREREKERDRERERDRDRDRDREKYAERDREKERDRDREKNREQRKEKYGNRDSQREDDSYHRRDRQRERSRSNEKKASRFRQEQRQLKPYKSQPQQQQVQPKKLFVSCRRCKQLTFSLVSRTCSSCGYPKETRPAYFPVAKQSQVLDLVREGKLTHNSYAPVLIQVVVNDRMGKRQRIKCCPSDSVLQFKKLISAQIGTRPEKIRLQKGNVIYKDHITLDDYEIKDGMGLEMYYD